MPVEYTKLELDLINKLHDSSKNNRAIAKECNKEFHNNRSIRSARGIEFVIKYKLNRTNDKYRHLCDVCNQEFRSGWVNARYCSDECRSVADREYANKLPPKKNVLPRQLKIRERFEKRWERIFEVFGDRCSECKNTFPRVAYDLHHVNGKLHRKDTPSKVIRNGTDKAFEQMLKEVILLCAVCHRLLHSNSGNWAPKRNGI